MRVFNDKMYRIFQTLQFGDVFLNKKLLTIISSGFEKKNGCFFLKKMFKKNQNVSKKDFIDNTGYECFVNSIHIDDYIEFDFLQQAFLLLEKTFELWRVNNSTLLLKGIVSETDFGANIKFHVFRKGETWIVEEDIDKFEEAIMIAICDPNLR